MEIEEIQIKNKYYKKDKAASKELIALEIQCRSNYCNVKSKQNDFDTVRLQALKILEIEENEKAYFRLAQA